MHDWVVVVTAAIMSFAIIVTQWSLGTLRKRVSDLEGEMAMVREWAKVTTERLEVHEAVLRGGVARVRGQNIH